VKTDPSPVSPGIEATVAKFRAEVRDKLGVVQAGADFPLKGQQANVFAQCENFLVEEFERELRAAVRLAQEAQPEEPENVFRIHRAECFIRELVAAHRVRGPLQPDIEQLCRAADKWVDGAS
jgi:hypothetical protein